MKIKVHRKKIGFTLIELMVSLSIFSIIMVISMGAVLSIVEANRKSRSLTLSMNNLNLVVETMARNIKFGTNWVLSSCTGGVNCTEVTFDDRFTLPAQALQKVSYRLSLSGTSMERRITLGPNATADYETITAPEITIQNFSLTPRGVGNDNKQPLLILTVRGVVGTKVSNQTSFDLQSAVSQRELELVEF